MPRCTNVVALRARLMREAMRSSGSAVFGTPVSTGHAAVAGTGDAGIGIERTNCWSIAAGLTASSGGALAKLACRAADSNAHSAFHRGQLAARGPIVRPDCGCSTHGLLIQPESARFHAVSESCHRLPGNPDDIRLAPMEQWRLGGACQSISQRNAKVNLSSTALLSAIALAVAIPQISTAASAAASAVQSVTPQSSLSHQPRILFLKGLKSWNPA